VPPLRLAFVLPYGQASDGFFPDTFAGVLAAEAVAAGHHARIARVYYVGDGGDRDAEIAARLTAWLEAGRYDVVVVERLFDDRPIAAFTAAAPHRRAILVVRGDSVEPTPAIELIVGWRRGPTRGGRTRRAVTIWQIADAFAATLAALAAGEDPARVPGVAVVGPEGPVAIAALSDERGPRRPLAPMLEHDAIALGPAPAVVRRTLFGNAGCPYAADPRALPLYRDLTWPDDAEVARLGCAFCSLGGDYERRPDAEVIASLVGQARHITAGAPTTRELVLDDQYALRYLAALIAAAAAAGVPPVRWLFAARVDTLVRERRLLDDAIAAAAAVGHQVEVYLTGFEAFSDVELARYNKGTTVTEQLAAIALLRDLAAAHPAAFAFAEARGHSLILWNPWTTPADLATSIAMIRAHGLRELFDELGRNRLRLYPDLPIFHAAAAAGAVVEAWPSDEAGAGAGKGYHHERPWRFLDPRTRLAWRLAERLRARLGVATEASQLAAVAAFAQTWRGVDADVAPTAAAIARALDELVATLDALARRDDGPPRGWQRRAAVVRLDGACNNGCAACPNGERRAGEPAIARIVAARADDLPIILAGREPTLRDDLPELLAAARGADRRPVGLVTNARRAAYPPFAAALARAGVTGASVKLFAPTAAGHDAAAQVDGAHAQAVAGAVALATHGVAVEARVAVGVGDPRAYLALRAAVPLTGLRAQVTLDAIDLGSLAAVAASARALAAACADAGCPLEVAPLAAGPTLDAWLPVVPSGSR
jgi:hypothetical protein